MQVGDVISWQRTFTEEDIRLFANAGIYVLPRYGPSTISYFSATIAHVPPFRTSVACCRSGELTLCFVSFWTETSISVKSTSAESRAMFAGP